MKKLALTILLVVICFTTYSQAKKPTLMVLPSDAWCIDNGYVIEYDNQGIKEVVPDFKSAFQRDTDLLLVISKINGLMAERGFPLKNAETVLKNINSTTAIDNMRSSKEGGSQIAESLVDQLLNQAKADIVIQLTWTVNKVGPKKTLTFNMQGLDSYTNKQIATAAGTGAQTFSSEVVVLLEEAVISYMDKFTNSLQVHFDDLFANGREASVRIKRWDDWEFDLESYFGKDDEELGIIIEDWLADNTVKGRFSTTDATENMMVFEQVRIPLYYDRNGRQRAMDTRRFASNLSRFLRDKFGIENKLTTRGLGEATLILGSK